MSWLRSGKPWSESAEASESSVDSQWEEKKKVNGGQVESRVSDSLDFLEICHALLIVALAALSGDTPVDCFSSCLLPRLVLVSLMNPEWLDVLTRIEKPGEEKEEQTGGGRLVALLPAILSRLPARAPAGSVAFTPLRENPNRVDERLCCSPSSPSSSRVASPHSVAVSQERLEEWSSVRQRVAAAVRYWWRDVASCVNCAKAGMVGGQGSYEDKADKEQHRRLQRSSAMGSSATGEERGIELQMVLASLACVLPLLRLLRWHLLRHYRMLLLSSAPDTLLLRHQVRLSRMTH